MPTVSVAHEEIYYARHGDAGVPLLCLHGAGGTHASWYNAVKLLHRVSAVVPDLPAHGQSTGQGRTTVAAYAGVVTALLDALQLPQVVLAGHSMGGAIALWLALQQPQRVRGLVLAGTGAKLRVHPDILQAAKDGRPIGAASTRPANAAPPATSSLPRQVRAGDSSAPEVIYGDWLACDTFDVMARLVEIHAPTLVLVGSQDSMTPAKYAGFLAKGITGATLVTIEGAGHSAMVDKPAEVAAALQGFIDLLPAG